MESFAAALLKFYFINIPQKDGFYFTGFFQYSMEHVILSESQGKTAQLVN